MKSSNKRSYPDPHWNFKQCNRVSFKARVFIISLHGEVHIDLKWWYLILIWFDEFEKWGKFHVKRVSNLWKYPCFARKKGVNLSSDFSLFSCKKGVKLLKISLEKGPFSILRTMMENPFFMEVAVPGPWTPRLHWTWN